MKKMGRREPQEDTGGEQTLGSDGPQRGVLVHFCFLETSSFSHSMAALPRFQRNLGVREESAGGGRAELTWVSDAHSETGQEGRGPQRDRLPDGHAGTLADPTVHRKST